MNQVADDIQAIIDGSDELMHYGTPRHSGRYPWGSGDDPYQRTRDLAGRIEQLKKEGWKETPENIQKEFGLTTTQYRAQKALASSMRRMDDVARAKSLKEDGLNNSEIGRKMGKSESTIRSLLNPDSEARMMQAKNTADYIRDQINKKGVVEIGVGVEKELGISREKMMQAVSILESEGYVKAGGRVDQVTNKSGQKTTITVLGPPGTPKSAAYDYENIHSLNEYVSHDKGQTFEKRFVYPKSMDSKRLMVRYAEDGGIDKDGIIELRRGVDDLSLGDSKYAQVRILVDNNRYLKGMAVYSDNMPDGIDVIFNTNKTKDTPKMEVLKDVSKNLKKDPDNPFGSSIREGGQSYYIDKNGKKQLSLINKRADEGDWTEWKDTLPAQFLSKQPLSLAKKQLNLAIEDKKAEFDDYNSLTNPTLKKHLLSKFADECDSAAVHLKAAALPGQKYHVIVPINALKDDEIYAPGYKDGTKLALIRYPHGGTFEIPVLTVNNKNKTAKTIIGTDSIDAVGITKKIADQLSGADFDGDTVMCIPTHDPQGRVKISHKKPLEELKGFDPTMAYGYDKKEVDSSGKEHYYRNGREFQVMSAAYKQQQMGVVSNLITDMTLLGATDSELAKAVKHSMVVIDAEKHKLDYKQSEFDNGISALKNKYQRTVDENGNVKIGGASTLISRAKGQATVDKRQGTPIVNVPGASRFVNGQRINVYDPSRPKGALLYNPADDLEYTVTKVNKRTGEVTTEIKRRTQKSTQMMETDDARTLISEAATPMEQEYARYANQMKALANKARVEVANTGKIAFSATAKATYAKEVKDLQDKVDNATKNKPKERIANIKASAEVNAKLKAYKEETGKKMSPSDESKIRQQALSKYRDEVGSVSRKDRAIKITDREWEAIQAGAISETKLKAILNNTDIDELRQRATPKLANGLSSSQISRCKSLASSGYTLAEIAKKMGKSSSTISKYLKGVE